MESDVVLLKYSPIHHYGSAALKLRNIHQLIRNCLMSIRPLHQLQQNLPSHSSQSRRPVC